MKDLNAVQLIGHLGHDPEVRYLDNGTALTTFNIATNHSYADGEDRQTETEWHRCTAWGKLDELCAQYLHTGSRVYVEGRLRTHRWEDESGQLRTIVEIVINDMIMLDSRSAAPVPEAEPDDPPALEAAVAEPPAPATKRRRTPASATATTQGAQRRRMPQPTDEDDDALPF
jgi:single-strand DNA-binding protein